MKLIVTLITLISMNALALTTEDIALCKKAATSAAVRAAKQIRPGNTVEDISTQFEKVSSTNKNALLFSVNLNACDDTGCGGLGYRVVTNLSGNTCRPVRVELTAEE